MKHETPYQGRSGEHGTGYLTHCRALGGRNYLRFEIVIDKSKNLEEAPGLRP